MEQSNSNRMEADSVNFQVNIKSSIKVKYKSQKTEHDFLITICNIYQEKGCVL